MSDFSLWRIGQVIGAYLGRGHRQTRSDRYGTTDDITFTYPFVHVRCGVSWEEGLFLGRPGAIPKMMVDGKNDSVISLIPVVEPLRCGIAKLPEDGKKFLRCGERPREPRSNLAMIGVYAFNNMSFESNQKLKPSWRNEMEITNAISLPIDSGFKVVLHSVEVWCKDTGKPDDILEANHMYTDH